MTRVLFLCLLIAASAPLRAAPPFAEAESFLEEHCAKCHDDDHPKGKLDLMSLRYDAGDPASFATWVKVHDRVQRGEMPPKKRPRPAPDALDFFTGKLAATLTSAEREITARDGRAMQRRLNAYEYENALRDLFHAPWLQIKGGLPDDGIASRFNKSGKALDISHVQVARFMSLADGAMREALAVQFTRPPTATTRYYAREQKHLVGEYLQNPMNTWPDRQATPILGSRAEPEVRLHRAPKTAGAADPVKREQEGVAWVSNAFPRWDATPLPVAGRYRVRLCGQTVWFGPNGDARSFSSGGDKAGKPGKPTWFYANMDDVSAGRRDEPIMVSAQSAGLSRPLGEFDLTPEPRVHELEGWLGGGESIMPKATRLYQPRPPTPTNPHAQRDGVPGVAFRWIEIEGPLYDDATTAGYRLMFGDLPLTECSAGGKKVAVTSTDPKADAARLLRGFMAQAYRRPVDAADEQTFLALIHGQLEAGVSFAEAMIAGYTAVLASPGFLVLEEQPGVLDDFALAARLALFLWNSPPDEPLRALAARGELHRPEVLRRETGRLLGDAKAARFVEAFLDYWLDLRTMQDTTPSIALYNDYYLDDALTDAALDETRLFFAELLRSDLPTRHLVASDFTFLNERLAEHYRLRDVKGVAMRREPLAPDSVRGGLLTQASVLKVTANGTTTSPVLRGVWINERILGHVTPPPPPVGTVEPDIRGAVTIRQQLEKHREDASCASCHAQIDPPGFALENFDVLGGWRDRYRGVAAGKQPVIGFGRNGAPFEFHAALPVDAAGELPGGRSFRDVRDFKRLLLEDEAQIARNLAQQLTTYATGAPVRFSDRAAIEQILQRAQPGGYGVRAIVQEIVQSELFLSK